MIKIHLSKILGERRITQLQLAKGTELKPNTISSIYNEKVTRLELETIDKICDYLGLQIQELIEYVPNAINKELNNNDN